MRGLPFVIIATTDKTPIAVFNEGRNELGGAAQKLTKAFKIVKTLDSYTKELEQAEQIAKKFDFKSALRKISYAVNKAKKEIPKISTNRNELLSITDKTSIIYEEGHYKQWEEDIIDIFNSMLDEASELITNGKKREAVILLKKLYKAPKESFPRFKEIKELYEKCK